MRATNWIKGFAALSVAIASLVALLNAFVDPYDLWESTTYSVSYNERMKKAYQLQAFEPKSIILGSSRVESGINPQHKYFTQPAYNLAFAGATAYETRLYVEKAIEIGSVEKILLVIGYRFFGKGKKTEDMDIPVYLSSSRITLLKTLFLSDTLKKSIKILLNKPHNKAVYSQLGQYDNNVYKARILGKGGHKKAFEKNEMGYYSTYDRDYIYDDGSTSSFDDFEQILELAYQNNIDLEIVIGPSHIRQWENLANYIGFDRFLTWKKDIVVSNSKVAGNFGQAPFKILDFAVYHEFTSEPVPEDSEESMQYYFDSSHYNERLGNIVLDTLNGDGLKDFGVQINAENIDAHLQGQENQRAQYIDIDAYREWFLMNEAKK